MKCFRAERSAITFRDIIATNTSYQIKSREREGERENESAHYDFSHELYSFKLWKTLLRTNQNQ